MYARNIVSYMRELKDAGVPDQQASIHAEKLAEFMENNLTTKEDLKNTEQRLDGKIEDVEQRLNTKIDGVEQRFEAKIDGVEQRLNAKIDGVEQRLDAKIDSVANHLEGKIENVRVQIGSVNTKLDWLIRLISVIAFVFAAVSFFHLYFPVK